MKTRSDPRHQKRRKKFLELFALSFNPQKISQQNQEIKIILPKIDKMIAKSAPSFPLSDISKVDLAILRLASFELLERKNPQKVVIDEAVELAKEFGGNRSFSFVNGVLGTVVKNL